MNHREPLDDRDERLVRDVQAARDDRFARKAWILLDWAASGFSTLVITLPAR